VDYCHFRVVVEKIPPPEAGLLRIGLTDTRLLKFEVEKSRDNAFGLGPRCKGEEIVLI
jgi:hypothetical protein